MSTDAWNPKQYDKFKAERSQPFFDLMALLQPSDQGQIIDLGCGTGELTAELHSHLKSKNTLGMDSSEEMLKKATAFTTQGLDFRKDNIETWNSPRTFDIIFSNAALQWCSNHPELFQRRGQLAVQMPMNHDYPTHVAEFRERLFEKLPDDKPFFYPFKRILIWGRL